MVIDDDESMRMLCLKALESEGHRVSCTGNPTEALAMLDHEPVDLLIVDVLLAPPGLQLPSKKAQPHLENGMRVVQAALAKRPHTPVLFISGHSQITLLNKGVDGKRWPVLQKPFSPTVLRTEVTIRLEAARDNTGPGLNPRKLDRYPIRCRVTIQEIMRERGPPKTSHLGVACFRRGGSPDIAPDSAQRGDSHQDPCGGDTMGGTPHFGLDFVLIEEGGERLLSEYVKRFVGRDDASRTQS